MEFQRPAKTRAQTVRTLAILLVIVAAWGLFGWNSWIASRIRAEAVHRRFFDPDRRGGQRVRPTLLADG